MKSNARTHGSSAARPEAPSRAIGISPELESRVLVHLAKDADSSLSECLQTLAKGGIRLHSCAGWGDLCHEISLGAGAALLNAATFSAKALAQLQSALSAAPSWSNVPLLVVAADPPTQAATGSRADLLNALGLFTLLERPLEPKTMLAGVRAALRARSRQYEVRDLLLHRAAQIQESSEQMDAFTYSVTHDLRAPLRAIRGFAQALVEDYGPALDEAGRDYLGRMAGGAEHLERLIQDLLQYSRLSRATVTLEPIDLESAVRTALLQLEPEIDLADASVEVRKPLPHVMAHEPTLHHVLTALLSNAIKFVAPRVKPRIRIWGTSEGSRARLWVADNGIGIAPAHQQRIFNVFERLHGVETYPGTGMGLAIVAKGVDRMGGTAGVDSAPGKGSQFWIELPLYKEGARD